MNYLEAKSVLLRKSPEVSFTLVAIEVVAMLGVASLLVWAFA